MKVASYYRYLVDGITNVAFEGMGGGYYWQDVVGKLLQREIGDATLIGHAAGSNSYDVKKYPVLCSEVDITYCQLFDEPHNRPYGFIWSWISDYIGNEKLLERWLERVRPNVLFTAQYIKEDIFELCKKYDCKCVFLPWFNVKPEPYYFGERKTTALITGAVGQVYPQRSALAAYMYKMGRDDVVVRCTSDQSRYPMSKFKYETMVSRTKYYVSGGIFDFQVPPKFYEICNLGACLVCPKIPMLEECGFVNGKTCIVIDTPNDLPDIFASDAWKAISLAGQKMVQERHMMSNRAEQIREEYNEYKKYIK